MYTQPRWVNEHHATQLVNRSRRTLQGWRKQGEVIAYNHGHTRVMYSVDSLHQCLQRMIERYRSRPNPGRPRTTEHTAHNQPSVQR